MKQNLAHNNDLVQCIRVQLKILTNLKLRHQMNECLRTRSTLAIVSLSHLFVNVCQFNKQKEKKNK